MLSVATLVSGLVIGAFYGVVGLGISFVLRVTRVLNLSHGGLIVVAGMTYAWATGRGHPVVLAATLALSVAAIGGLLLGLVLRPWMNEEREIIAVFLTLAVGLLLEGVALYLFGRDPVSAAPALELRTRGIGGAAVTGPQQILLAATLLGSVLFAIWLRRSRAGKLYSALVDDHLGAAVVGVPVARLQALAFAIGGLFAGIAAVAITPPTSMSYAAGSGMLVSGLTASILGGIGNPFGALAGGAVVGVIQTAVAVNFGSLLMVPTSLGLLLVVLIVRPEGLLPARAVSRAV